MIYVFILGVGLIACVLIYTNSDQKSTESYTGAVNALMAQQKKALTTDDFIKAMTATKLQMDTLEEKCVTLIEQRSIELDAKIKKLSSEQDFMRVRQHGLDKLIAGSKKEIIFNITRPIPVELVETPKIPAKKPKIKPLLDRAGVSQ